ncbi:MAG: ferritin family protein [Rhodospirillales bacterium]
MANITFRSPVMAKDVTVYAVAGARGSILALAKAHRIPIPFDCGDGECGSCLIEVTRLGEGERMGGNMQEKEKEMLRQLGKISAAEIDNAEVYDVPSRHRLACQYIVRNEDILVCFDGDETLPAKRPAMSLAAGSFKGGIEMTSPEMFLAYSIKVEEEAAVHFDELGEAMEKCGNTQVAKLFRQFAGYSRLHWEQAKERAGSRDVERYIPEEHMWPRLETPEQTSLWAGDPAMSRRDALKAALQGERQGFEFYHHIAETARSKEIRALAKEFADEEAEHVAILERWIAGEEVRLAASPA